MNYFEVFGLPKTLGIDPATLEKSFYELSRKFHPDYFTTAPQDQRDQALRMTALLNDAYRTLKNPIRRVEYLVELEGFKPDGSKVPKELLMEVFEINEQLEEAKAGRLSVEEKDSLHAQICARADEFNRQLQKASLEWDDLLQSGATDARLKAQLTRLTEILSESSYIRNLEEELANAG
jgi:molecular chaperone HscB